MFQVVGFHGYVGSGKDEAARAIEATHVPVAFADKIREGLFALNPIIGLFQWGFDVRLVRLREYVESIGWIEAKKHPEVRRLMQSFGTEAGRHIHGELCWNILARERSHEILMKGGNVAFTDIRHEDEEQLCHEFGGIILHIVKPNNGPANDHSSEHQKIKCDAVIINDGTIEDLHRQVREYVNCSHSPSLDQW